MKKERLIKLNKAAIKQKEIHSKNRNIKELELLQMLITI